MKFISSLIFTFLFFFSTSQFGQGFWTQVTNSPVDKSGGLIILLSDGSVLAKNETGGSGGIGNGWNKLTPDASGSYINGTWSSISSMSSTRLYFSSQILKDGRLYVAGGEYGTGKSAAEIYNPVTNTWTNLPAPGAVVSDANSEILPDGRVLQAMVNGSLKTTTIYNPVTNSYSAGPTCNGIHNESAWVKLPDNSILFVDRLSTNSERYIPATNTWVTDATVPVALYDPSALETGSALLLPDGRAWFVGSNSKTAYYTPSGTASPGTWAAGPNVPSSLGAPDAASAMMVNGKILCAVSPTPTSGNNFPTPTSFFEFDYLSNSYTLLPPPYGAATINQPVYVFNMLDLPDGKVLLSQQDTNVYFVYTPNGPPLAAGQPTITNILQNGCNSFTITGMLFNGISEGASYGDDWQMNSNYPLIRLTKGGNVYYARSFNWNRTSVMTGTLPDTTQFTLPVGLPVGTYSLEVVANGIASNPVTFIPFATLSSTLSPPAVCSGSAFTYSASSASAGAAIVWTRALVIGISNAAITIPQTSDPNETLINTSGTSKNVIYSYTTSANGCSTVQQVTLVVNPTPTVSATAANTVICDGTTTGITATGASTYSWSTSAITVSITVTPSITTTYSVTGTDLNGCSSSAVSSITVNALPTLSAGTSNSLICTQPVQQTATLTAAGANTYTWTPGGAGVSIAVSPTITSTYTLNGTDLNGCTNSSTFTQSVSLCTEIAEQENNENEFILYPNPAHSKAILFFNSVNPENVYLRILDVFGRCVKEEFIKSQPGANTKELVIEDLSKGLYIVNLQKGTLVLKVKLIVD